MEKLRKLNGYKFYLGDRPLTTFSNFLKFQSGHLLCGKLTQKTYPPMKISIFENGYFTNLITDSDSSQKSVWRNYSSFFKILILSRSKMQKYPFFEGKLTYPQFSYFFAFLTHFQSEFWKKKSSFFTYFFERNPNLSDLW